MKEIPRPAVITDILPRLPAPFRRAAISQIALGESGCLVYRLTLHGASAILKVSSRALMPDYLRLGHPESHVAEYLFYTELLPLLDIPAPKLLLGERLADDLNYILLEDVSPHHVIPSLDHEWSTAELLLVVEVYAALHGRAPQALAKHASLAWLKQDPRQEYNPERAHTLLAALYDNAWTRAIVAPVFLHPRLEVVLTGLLTALAHMPPTLLHNDFYPLNIGLPRDATGKAVLMDYQLLGLGPGMLDILNIGFLHPQPHFCSIDRDAVLGHYLRCLAAHTGGNIGLAEFRRLYTFAVILGWADYLPRFVRAVQRKNLGVEPWNDWLERTLRRAMSEWEQALVSHSL